MEEPSDSENPATVVSTSQVNTDSDSGSEYASAEEELREGTDDGARSEQDGWDSSLPGGGAAAPPCSQPPAHAAPVSHHVSRDREVPDISIASPPCLAAIALPTSAVPSTSQTAPVARGPGATPVVDSQPPDRRSTDEEPHNQVQDTEDEPSALRLQQFNQVGATGNIQAHTVNFCEGNNQLQSIAARTSANLERACPQGYVKTSSYYTALLVLKKHGCSIITGTSGSGKTTLAQHLLLALHDKGFLPLEFITPDECQCVPWQKVGDENHRLVLLVDNVVGAGNYEDELRRKWEIQLKPMKPFIERGHVIVILASRANIYAAIRGVKGSGQILFEAPEISLDGKDCQLSGQEREEILKKTLAFHKVKLPDEVCIRLVDLFAMDIGFPQLCVYLATSQTALRDPVAFVQSPVQFLEGEFQKLKLDDRLSYFVLILVLLQEGSLSEEFLKDKTKKEFFTDVADLVGLPMVHGSGKILEIAKQLCESYLNYNTLAKSFSFIHQSVWDILFSQFCRSDFEKAVDVCTWKQLAMYVRTDPRCEESEEFVYVVPPCDWPILAKRLLQELTSGNADRVCSHPCLQHPDFVQELLEKFLTCENITRLLETQQENLSIFFTHETLKHGDRFTSVPSLQSNHSVIFSFQSPMSHLLLSRCSSVAKHILQSAQFQALFPFTQSLLLTEALACALFMSDTNLVDWLLDRGTEPSEECVKAACHSKQEHVGLVERALQWDSVLSAELLTEMARVASQDDRPRTLELVLSRLPKSASTQAELDVILAELILLTHQKLHEPIRCKQIKVPSNSEYIFSTLKKAGAQFRSHVDPFTAAELKNPSALSEWLEHEVDLSVTDRHGSTLLHHAAEYGAMSNMQALLDATESRSQLAQLVNVQNRGGDTALHLAAGKGHLAVVDILLKNGADANLTNDRDETALLKLACCSEWKTEGRLSPSEEAASFSSISSGFQCHHSAATDIKVKEMLRMLATKPVSCDYTFDRECEKYITSLGTPLHGACGNGHCLLVEVLVERGVHINVFDMFGMTPVHIAARRGILDVLKLLYRNAAQLHLAAEKRHLPLAEMLIHKEVNINAEDKRKRTPLHMASVGGHDQVVKWLLDNGAEVNATDEDGQQPIHLASGRGHFSVVKCLLDAGASVNVKDKFDTTCLHLASGAGDVPTLDFLLTCGLCVNVSDADGRSPLCWALREGRYVAAQFLMHAGADANAMDQNGNTMLHALAASSARTLWGRYGENSAVVSLVKSFSRFTDHQNKEGDTPVILAVKHGRYRVLREMLKLQCDLSIRNDKGDTALHLAVDQRMGMVNEGYDAAEECLPMMAAKCVKALHVKNKKGEVPFLLIATAGNFPALKECLKHPVDCSVKDKVGNTVFHMLANRCYKWSIETDESFRQIMESTLNKYAELAMCPNNDGDTPIFIAARHSQWFLLSLFLKHVGDLRFKGKGGNTILHEVVHRLKTQHLMAAYQYDLGMQVVESLVTRCAELATYSNDEGDTPVLIAVRNKMWILVSVFAKHHVDISVKGRRGNTILHEIVHGLDDWHLQRNESFREKVGSLLSRCADLALCCNDDGDTPVLTAVRERKWTLLSLFLKHPEVLSARGKRGNTFLHELVCGLEEWHIDKSTGQIVESF